jgi:hypothetical protein
MADAVSQEARRRFLKLATAGVVAAPLGGMLVMRRAQAQQKVSESEDLAKQLGYKPDASQVDASAFPTYVKGHHCGNCQLFHGKQGEEWGPCDIFGGELVNVNGWCSAWTERSG